MAAYPAIKALHIACVAISGLGFAYRGLAAQLGGPPLRGWRRWVIHINDTLLLGAGVSLALLSGQYPLVDGWLTAKLFGLIAYIVLGSIALRTGRRGVRAAAWLAAMGLFAYLVSVAVSKNPLGFLALIVGGD